MAFVEVLVDGLTVGGKVRMAGEAVSDPALEPVSKTEQVKKWGQPRYKEISEKEFNERGGSVAEVAPEMVPPEPSAEQVAGSENEFTSLADLNVDDTLSAVAEFDDEKTARFIEFEKSGAARKGVLGPLGVEVE